MGDRLNVYSVHSGAIIVGDPRSFFLVINQIFLVFCADFYPPFLMVNFPVPVLINDKLPRGYKKDWTLPRT